MKYIPALTLLCLFSTLVSGQNTTIDGFLRGKSVVLVSTSPTAQPVFSWKELADQIHMPLVEAGGDPVAYYELEEVVLSEEIQTAYANAFNKRMIKNIIVVTRKEDATFSLHLIPFSGDKNILLPGDNWSTSSPDLAEFKEKIRAVGFNRESENFLVLEVPEFPNMAPEQGAASGTANFIRRMPLNLDVFKLGVILGGASGEAAYLTSFRYDLLGKSPEQRLAEQEAEKKGLEEVFEQAYPYEVEFLSSLKPDQELIRDRVQFILMRIEGREGDIMQNMGIPIPESVEKDRIVVKYYMKFLIRNEFYIGQAWDAHPDWKVALEGFLNQVKN